MGNNITPTLNPVDWSVLRYYEPADFKHPDKLDHTAVAALDSLVDALGTKPEVIDDWRPPVAGKDSQHPLGRALDWVVPGLDSLVVLDKIRTSRLFNGFGFYTNERGAQSFHTDTRTDRTFNNPATWGAWKNREAGIEQWQYVAISDVIAMVKKSPAVGLLLIMGIVGLWLWSRSR